MACSHRLRGRDKNVLSCRVGGVKTIEDQTKLSCLVCSCVHTDNADSSKLGRDETKLSRRRCEQAIRVIPIIPYRRMDCSIMERGICGTMLEQPNAYFISATRTLVRVGGVNRIGDKTRQFFLVSTQFSISKFSVVLNIFETEQLQIGNWVETRLSCLVDNSVNTADTDNTRQFFLSVSAV